MGGALDLGLKIEGFQAEQLYDYYTFLMEKNKVMNLTSITDEDGVIFKHFIDSLSIVKVLDAKTLAAGGMKAIDVGTGAGFPGLVLKIVFTGLDVILLDATKKKLDFLNELINNLGLKNVRTLYGRAEDLGRDPDYRESCDLVTSRAVAYLPVLFEYCLPFLKIGGTLVAYKSEEIAEEVAVSHNALKLLGGSFLYANNFLLPGPHTKRCLVVAKKGSNTPLVFPRRVGVPLKKPL